MPTSAEYIREQLRAAKEVAAEPTAPEAAGVVRPQGETRLEEAADQTAGDRFDPTTGEVIDDHDKQWADYVEAEVVEGSDEEEPW